MLDKSGLGILSVLAVVSRWQFGTCWVSTCCRGLVERVRGCHLGQVFGPALLPATLQQPHVIHLQSVTAHVKPEMHSCELQTDMPKLILTLFNPW